MHLASSIRLTWKQVRNADSWASYLNLKLETQDDVQHQHRRFNKASK